MKWSVRISELEHLLCALASREACVRQDRAGAKPSLCCPPLASRSVRVGAWRTRPVRPHKGSLTGSSSTSSSSSRASGLKSGVTGWPFWRCLTGELRACGVRRRPAGHAVCTCMLGGADRSHAPGALLGGAGRGHAPERCWAEPTEATPPGTHRAGRPCAADPQPERRGLDKHRRGDLATQAGGMRSGGRLRCKVSFGDDVVRGSARGWPRGRLPHGARGLAGVVGGGDGELIFASSRSELHSASHPVCCTLIRVAIYFYSLLLILPSCHCSSSMGCRCRYCVGRVWRLVRWFNAWWEWARDQTSPFCPSPEGMQRTGVRPSGSVVLKGTFA